MRPVLNCSDHPCGDAQRERVVWDVVRDDRASTYDDVVADCHAGAHRHVVADPHVVADGYRIGVFQTPVAPPDVKRMTCGIEAAVGRDEHVVAERDLCAVKDDGVVVGEEVRSNLDVVPVVAPEGRQDREGAVRFSEEIS